MLIGRLSGRPQFIRLAGSQARLWRLHTLSGPEHSNVMPWTAYSGCGTFMQLVVGVAPSWAAVGFVTIRSPSYLLLCCAVWCCRLCRSAELDPAGVLMMMRGLIRDCNATTFPFLVSDLVAFSFHKYLDHEAVMVLLAESARSM